MKVKNRKLAFIRRTIELLNRLEKRWTPQENTEPFILRSLAPTDNADPEGHYQMALFWALTHREKEDIKNIAFTGPYGSGKSSILKTFWKKHEKDWKFLNISLATFKENKNAQEPSDVSYETSKIQPANGNEKRGEEELLRLIELSVLQQIFYHEEDKNIPDSRFKKIKSVSHAAVLLGSIGFVFAGFAFFILLKPQTLLGWLDMAVDSGTRTTINIIALVTLALAAFFVIRKSIRSLMTFTVNKLNIQSAEIEIGKDISKSVLNNHLDEILYFFETAKYEIVVIEDLDRFEQTEIFTKLRELNLLINNSKKVKQPVTFIYAVCKSQSN